MDKPLYHGERWYSGKENPPANAGNTKKSLAFLYTNNEKIGREIKETIPFTIATKGILRNIST